MDIFLLVVSWTAPPFLGGLIGYWTNRVAIMMLFRPLTAKHVLGVHVPLTPGVIPGKRKELAESVGSLVGDEFFSQEAIRRYMSEPAMQSALETWLRERIPVPRIPESFYGRLAEFGARWIGERAAELRDKLDAATLIANKVNDYEVAEVEKLILPFMAQWPTAPRNMSTKWRTPMA